MQALGGLVLLMSVHVLAKLMSRCASSLLWDTVEILRWRSAKAFRIFLQCLVMLLGAFEVLQALVAGSRLQNIPAASDECVSWAATGGVKDTSFVPSLLHAVPYLFAFLFAWRLITTLTGQKASNRLQWLDQALLLALAILIVSILLLARTHFAETWSMATNDHVCQLKTGCAAHLMCDRQAAGRQLNDRIPLVGVRLHRAGHTVPLTELSTTDRRGLDPPPRFCATQKSRSCKRPDDAERPSLVRPAYVPRKVLLCMQGTLARGIRFTWPMIYKMIVQPLRKLGHAVDIAGFNLDVGGALVDGTLLDQRDVNMVPFKHMRTAWQPDVDIHIKERCNRGSCPNYTHGSYQRGNTCRNARRALVSDNQLGILLEQHHIKRRYDVALVWGPDFYPYSTIDVAAVEHAAIRPDVVFTSDRHDCGGYTDGFYIGSLPAVSKVLTRWGDETTNAAREFYSFEDQLRESFCTNNITRMVSPMEWHKVRARGFASEDFVDVEANELTMMKDMMNSTMSQRACFREWAAKRSRCLASVASSRSSGALNTAWGMPPGSLRGSVH